MSRVIPCIPVLIGAEERGEFSGPQRQDETIIARRVGCTEVDRCERGNHAGGKWPPRRQRRAVCSGHGVVLHLEDRIVRESEVSTYKYLTKNNFILFPEILEHVFHVVNQMRP